MQFLIKYRCYSKQGLIKSGTMRVKNRQNSLDAKVSLDRYFEKTLPEFSYMVVDSCEEDLEILDFFNGIFKT